MSVPPASKPLATKPRAVVIGAGVAGLAAACLMSKDYDVTVLEKNPESGGRVGRLRDCGFLWDTGPSWLLMPDAYKRFYQRMGTTMEAELDLVRLDPAYRVFHEGFDPVDVRSGIPEVRAGGIMQRYSTCTGANLAVFDRVSLRQIIQFSHSFIGGRNHD